MTTVRRWRVSNLPMSTDMPMTGVGFKTHDDVYKDKMKLYGGFKRECKRCPHECKQWDSKSLRIIYCPAMDRRAK